MGGKPATATPPLLAFPAIVVLNHQMEDHRTHGSPGSDGERRAILKVAIETGEREWRTLPADLQDDVAFARSISHFPHSEQACAILRSFPELCRDRDYWERIIGTLPYIGYLHRLFVARLPSPEIRSDYDLMLKACRRTFLILHYVDPHTLGTDRGFLETVLSEKPGALQCMSPEAQRLFPELVVQTFPPLAQYVATAPHNYAFLAAGNIIPEVWENRSNILEWFKCGLPFGSVFPDSWKDDREIFLLIAKHCPDNFRYYSFSHAAPALRGDKDYMQKVLELAPPLFVCASEMLQRDFDLALLCFADSSDTVVQFVRQNGRGVSQRMRFLREFCHRAFEMMRVHKVFVSTILFAVSPGAGSGSPLSILDQGVETAMSHKKVIAEFLGVPTGKTLRRLRRAYENINEALERLSRP